MNAGKPVKTLAIQPGDTYLSPEGLLVFTEKYHLRRGYCCGSGCRHCPFKAAERNLPLNRELKDEK